MSSLAIKTRASFITMPELLLLMVAIVWGTSYGLTKTAIAYTSISMFIAIRFGLTGFLLLPLALKDFKQGKNRDWKVAIPTGVILALIFFFEVYGVSQTTASNAAFLISLNVIFTALVDSLLSKNKPSQSLMLLSVISTVGVLLLTYHQDLGISLNSGDLCILTAAALRALMVTMTKKLTDKKQITNTTLTCIQAFAVAVSAYLVGSLIAQEPLYQFPTDREFWLVTAFLVLFCTLFAFYAQNYAVRKISPTKASLLMGSEPLFGALFSMMWLNETLSNIQWIGAAILLFSVLAASVNKPNKV